MPHFPKWFLLEESAEARARRHAELRNQLADKEYQDRLASENAELRKEREQDAKDKKKGKGRHRRA